MASTNSSVSYYQVYKRWLSVDHRRKRESTIPVNNILLKLIFREVVVKSEYRILDHEKTDEEKSKKLFLEIMPAKGEKGFNQLMEILLENNYNDLANDLGAERDKCLTDVSTAIQNPLNQIQTHLSRLIKENVDFMVKYWSRYIRLARTETAFVQVQVLEHFKAKNGNPVGSYREVFDKDEKTIHTRILIQADPGCGKTTYVNKLALDWANEDANENEYLRDKFDFVFLISLQTLTMDVLDAIKCFLPEESEKFFASYAKSCDSKILLILDGFDELVESSQWYSSVMGILEGKSMQFQFYHIIVTTRRSHVDKIPKQFDGRSLLIKGFDEESMKQFLIKQHIRLRSVGQESNLSHLLQTPLFCAIYCSLYYGRGDPIELEDSYDLIKALVDTSVTNTVRKKKVANVEGQLNEIGKFAFQMLDSSTMDFLKKFCRSSEVIKPSFDLSRVNLDLLIKRTIPLDGVLNRFKEEFSLPHQLIAEYLAATYFARSLTKEQLKQVDTSKLIPAEFYRVLDLPFVRFFLLELLFLYLEKKYVESVFDNFLNIPQLQFIWNYKSNTDIRTLDNVSDLDIKDWNHELINHSRFIPTLSKCRNLSSLKLWMCGLSKNQVEQLVNFINKNFFHKLLQLDLSWNKNVGSTHQLFTALSKCKHLQVLHLQWCRMTAESTAELARCIDNNGLPNVKELDLEGNENVGSTPQLFTALSKCKHLQVLHLQWCELTAESITELARCIGNNGLADLTKLQFDGNENVGSSTELFHVLYKCPQLQKLYLYDCSMTQESLNIFLSMFNSNTFQQLDHISLSENEDIKVDNNFFIALEKCPKISSVYLSKRMESDLSEVGRKAKETLEQRGCLF